MADTSAKAEGRYYAAKYKPMPTDRWAVWKRLKRCDRLELLIPDKEFAKEFAEDVADAFNEQDAFLKRRAG